MLRVSALLIVALLATTAAHAASDTEEPQATGLDAFAKNPAAGEYLVHRNADVAAKLQAMEEASPDLVTVSTAGTSVGGQDLWVVDLVLPDAEPRYRVYLDGGHHGNEYMGVELTMAYLGYLHEGYKTEDPEVMAFLEDHAVRALPMVNPDGNLLDTRKNLRQVDLNRNYAYEWGGEGAGADPTSFTYRGPEPLSEPETRANVAAAEAFDPDIWITGHTGIAEFYWPWGYTHDAPPDNDMFLRIEKPFEDATNGRVDAMQAAALYLAAGATDDYGYGEFGVPSFTFEVHEDQFRPVYPDTIPAAIKDQLAGLIWITSHTAHLGANVAAAPPVADGTAATVTLTNDGWGNATNVTVQLLKDGAVVATQTVDLPYGATKDVVFEDVGEGPFTTAGTYPRLLIDTSPVWDIVVEDVVPSGAVDGPLTPVPVPGAVLALIGLAGAATLARRR